MLPLLHPHICFTPNCEYSKSVYKGPVDVDHLYKLANLRTAMFGDGFDDDYPTEHCAGDDAYAGAEIAANKSFWGSKVNKYGGMKPVDLYRKLKTEQRQKKMDRIEAPLHAAAAAAAAGS